MSTFPALKTGAVMQYPAQRSLQFATLALQFVDGSEQRFRGYAAPLHRWVVQLTLLDQSELDGLQEFFRGLEGAAQNFAFTDPANGTNYPSCSLQKDSMAAVLAAEWNGQTSLTIVENGS